MENPALMSFDQSSMREHFNELSIATFSEYSSITNFPRDHLKNTQVSRTTHHLSLINCNIFF